MPSSADCKLISSPLPNEGKQGLNYAVGISAATANARSLHFQKVVMPPLGWAKAHKHDGHETAIFALRGVSGCWYGDALEHHAWVQPGDYFYIPADMPHLPYNPSASDDFVAIIARTDPNDQESVTLLPDLDRLPHLRSKSSNFA